MQRGAPFKTRAEGLEFDLKLDLSLGSPSSALLPFYGGGSPYTQKKRQQKKGHPYSNLSAGGPRQITGSWDRLANRSKQQTRNNDYELRQFSKMTAGPLPKRTAFPLIEIKLLRSWVALVYRLPGRQEG